MFLPSFFFRRPPPPLRPIPFHRDARSAVCECVWLSCSGDVPAVVKWGKTGAGSLVRIRKNPTEQSTGHGSRFGIYGIYLYIFSYPAIEDLVRNNRAKGNIFPAKKKTILSKCCRKKGGKKRGAVVRFINWLNDSSSVRSNVINLVAGHTERVNAIKFSLFIVFCWRWFWVFFKFINLQRAWQR